MLYRAMVRQLPLDQTSVSKPPNRHSLLVGLSLRSTAPVIETVVPFPPLVRLRPSSEVVSGDSQNHPRTRPFPDYRLVFRTGVDLSFFKNPSLKSTGSSESTE